MSLLPQVITLSFPEVEGPLSSEANIDCCFKFPPKSPILLMSYPYMLSLCFLLLSLPIET